MVKNLVTISVEDARLTGELSLPDNAQGMVIFSHGSGSSRFSPRNNFVAQQLQRKGLGTFLADLHTREEDLNYSNRFDIPLLAERLIRITRHMGKLQSTRNLPMAYFGASTGAASSIVAASRLPGKIRAIVSRGGRPDLAGESLSILKTPLLLIVGSLDSDVLKLNRYAFNSIQEEKRLVVIEGASHLFEEPGTLEQVAGLSADWLQSHFSMKSQGIAKV